MTGISKPTSSLVIFTIGVILLMYLSNRILYLRYVPESIVYFYNILSIIIFIRYNNSWLNKANTFCVISSFLIFVIYIYDQVQVGILSVVSLLITLITIIVAFILITCPCSKKVYIIKAFTNTTVIIIGVAIIGWILYLLGVNLPHYTDTSDPFYIHTIYYIFNLNGFPNLQLIPRFAGPFLEPGHLGTMSVFLLYLNEFKLGKIQNIILLIAVILSLSLAAYGLLVGAVLLTLYIKKHYGLLVCIMSFFIFIGLGATLYNGGDNPINQAIVLRLEMDSDGEIAGNNRTTGAFDRAYDRFLESDQLLFGVGNAAFGTRGNGTDNITIGCATYKRYFYLRGIFGSVLIIAFLLFYFIHYKSKQGCGFLIVYIVANCIRDYPTMPMWMFLYLLAIPILHNKAHCKQHRVNASLESLLTTSNIR